jgi:hypothetical protein
MKTLTFNNAAIKGFLTKMNDDFYKCFEVANDSRIIKDLAKWFLVFAEHAQNHPVTKEFVAEWYCNGKSNAYGNSFGEKHKVDPLKMLLSLPDMTKYKSYFEAYLSNAALAKPRTCIACRWMEYKSRKTL